MASIALTTGNPKRFEFLPPPSQGVTTQSEPYRDTEDNQNNLSGLRKRVSQVKTTAELREATQTIAASGQQLRATPTAVPLQNGGRVGEIGKNALSRATLSKQSAPLTSQRMGLSGPLMSDVKARQIFTLEQLKNFPNPTTAQSVYLGIGKGIEKASKLATHPGTNYACNLYFNYNPSKIEL